ncbi:HAD family phosphatase [Candidatus Micrarchaeota archaeon]|nr:HAD family phosphatase [Candidatus Micrarchaeota archaeon]
MVKALIFDFDGVIVDSEPAHYSSFLKTLKPLGININEKRWYTEFVGTGSYSIMETLFQENGIKENVEDWVQKRKKVYWELIDNNELNEKNGIRTFLSEIRKMGKKTAIASGAHIDSINRILRIKKLESYFDFVLGRENVKNGKPHPEVFLKAAEMLGAKNTECIVIEDSKKGIEAAKSAGMKIVCLNSPFAEFRNCFKIINDYTEFPMGILE